MEKIDNSDIMAYILKNRQITLRFNDVEVLKSRNLLEIIDKLKKEEEIWKDENDDEDNLQIYVKLRKYRKRIESIIVSLEGIDNLNDDIFIKSIQNGIMEDYGKSTYFSLGSNNGPVFQIKFPSMTQNTIIAKRILLGYKIFKKSEDYEKFQDYINLINHKYNAKATDYLNSNDESKIVAVSIYLKIMVKDSIPGPIVEGININDLFKRIDEETTELERSITQERERFVQFNKNYSSELEVEGKNWLKDYEGKLSKLKEITNNFLQEKRTRIKDLEDTYDTKLSLEDVAKFWEKEAEKNKKSTWIWLGVSIGIALLMILSGVWFLNTTQQDFSHNQIAKIVPIYFAPLAVISLLLYLLRTTINIALSSRHVAIEYEQKNALTNYYLSMLQSGKIDDKEKSLVLPALFTKIDTGLNGKGNTNSEDQLQSLIGLLLKQK